MSWLSQMLKGIKILDVLAKIKEEAPHAADLLEALKENDYNKAADVVLGYGDVQEAKTAVATEIAAAIEKAVAAAPADQQEAIRAILTEHLSPEVQGQMLKVILSVGLRASDEVIPEEAMLTAMKLVGLV